MAYKGLSLEGKKALVFGGTSGLGRSIALGFAEAGADHIIRENRQLSIVELDLTGSERSEFDKSAASVKALVDACQKIAPDLGKK